MRKLLILSMMLSITLVSLGQQSGVQARVVAAELNVRDGYAPDSTIVGIVPFGETVNVLGREDIADNGGIWMYISATDRDVTGWVLSYYLEFDENLILSAVPVMNAGNPQPEAEPATSVENAPPAEQVAQPVGDGMSGRTTTMINLRGGPGTNFEVLEIIPANASVIFTGRNLSGTWLQTEFEGQTGWLSYTYVDVRGNVNDLPVIGANNSVQPSNEQPQAESASVPMSLPGVVPQVGSRAREIYLRGLELGNNPGVFAKIGDSITATDLFLNPIGHGGAQLGEYGYLQGVIQFFSQVAARDHFSFANTSLSARGGWSTFDVLNPNRGMRGVCESGEMPLECEYRVNRPSVALIMLGTNDANWVGARDFQTNMVRIVEISIERGVIPVLSTIPDQLYTSGGARVGEFNDIIINIARTYNIPLWNYWLAMQDLPNFGLSADGVHPSYAAPSRETAIFTPEALQYGYNMRNLTALMVLDAVWRGAMY